jgi:ABC-type multidrug transport system ATPase subunit
MMIEIRDLSKKYRNHEALQNLSLSVSEGSALVVVGANGAGKTTMIKILMNLIEATSGTAEILGVDSRRLSPKQLAQIGYVSEDQLLPGRLTVSEYLNYLRPFYPTWDKQLEAATLKQFRLPRDRRIHALSHGMRLKMSLACALPYRPRLLVLDEPCSGLDPLVRDEFMDGLLEHAGEMTVLMSTHELSEVEGFGTDVAYIEEGRLMFHESMEALTGRMQEIRVTTSGKGRYRPPPPKSWIDVKETGNVVTFVHREFIESELEAQIGASIADVVRIEVTPMPLRSIFVSLARAERDQNL